MRTIEVRRRDDIPRLAWAVRVDLDSGNALATIGPWVESRPDAIFEGAWCGDVLEADFSNSYSFTGSGAIIRGDDIVIVSPCHTIEAVYSVRGSRSLHFSNSIAFLLQEAGASLDLNYLDYEADALSISKGLGLYRRTWPLAEGREMGVHYYCNLVVSPKGGIREESKPKPSPMTSFLEYRQFLSDVVAAVHQNATDARRAHQYHPLVFCSNGYDSSTCAALGREIACDEAVVFESKNKSRSDSGRRVVEALNYSTIHEMEELAYRERRDAHLFVATGELGTSIYFAAAADELQGKLVLSGVHGDKMWDRAARVNDQIYRSPYPDTARKEFRLCTGYTMLAPAFLTVGRMQDIVSISNSADMTPWTLNNDYDRPIPRRIVEEAGVPRNLFGQHKDGGAGSSLRFGTLAQLRRVMPHASFEEFLPYLRAARRKRKKMNTRFAKRAVAYLFFLAAVLLDFRGLKAPARLVWRWPTAYQCSVFAPSYLFPWGVSVCAQSYRDPATDNRS
ncbi:hypothetical protein ACI78T_06650 [Blastococcus sp. SYSU D00922]